MLEYAKSDIGNGFRAFGNLDFGADWGNSAVYNYKNGHYVLGTMQLLNGMEEAVIDSYLAMIGAGVFGAGVASTETLFATGSITSAYISFQYDLQNNLGIAKDSLSFIASAFIPETKSSRKYTTAFNFYKNAGFSEAEAIDHMQGIEFEKKVQVKKLKKGSYVEQWQNPKYPQGKYYCPVGTDPNTLGINTEGRVKFLYKLSQDTYVLQSTAKNTLGNSNLPVWAQGEGGGIQFFTTEQQNFIEVK